MYAGTGLVTAKREVLPLSLYSVGSSLFLMLNDEDAREFAYESLRESLSEPLVDAGRTFSSSKVGTPLDTGGLRPKGLRKGGMAG